MFLNNKNINFKSTFYKWMISLYGIRSLHYLAILKDFETNLRAKVDSTLIANSWNSLLECYAKNNLSVWIIMNLYKNSFADFNYCFVRFFEFMNYTNDLINSGTSKFNDAPIIVMIPPTIISFWKVNKRFLKRLFDSLLW